MREGRRRPSLHKGLGRVVSARHARNEGGAPAPLVADITTQVLGYDYPAMREGRRRPSLGEGGFV